MDAGFLKLSWQDLNLRVPESKSGALPLGDSPLYGFVRHVPLWVTHPKSVGTLFGWPRANGGTQTPGLLITNQLLYHLSYISAFCK